jgi:hypothetical protein
LQQAWRARGQERAPVSKCPLPPAARAFVECAVLCAVRGCCCACAALRRALSLARSLARWCCSGERWLRALAFSLPTSTSSARGVVQFWLTRRPTPAAIYGHRHPGGVSGLALSSRLFSHSPLPVRQSFQSHHSRCASTTTAFRFDLHDLYHTPKIPVFDSLHDLNDIFH